MKMRLTLGILMLWILSVIKVLNLAADGAWEQKANMPTLRSGFTTCIVNGKIYAIGGYVDGLGDLSLSTVEVYDPKTDKWERKADMPTARTDAATSVVNGKIYAIGGTVLNRFEFDVLVNGQINRIPRWKAEDISTVEMYDPDTDTWAKAKNMNRARAGAAVSVVDGEIYVMGGTGLPLIINHPGPFLSSMEVYNPQKNRWREIGDMPTAKSNHTTSVINGKIYVMGGSFRNQGQDTKNFKTIEIYRPRTGRWTQKPDMPAAKAGHKAEVINVNIYIIDGPAHNNTPFATIEVYDTGEFHQSVDPIDKRIETWGMLKKVDRLPR